MVQFFKKGEKLPNGLLAKANCTWCEGYLWLGDGNTRADKIWDLSMAMQKSGAPRALGYSIQGTVTKRMGPARKIVAEAIVTHTAITNCPVNVETKMETLAKSLSIVAQLPNDLDKLLELEKALTMGAGSQLSIAGAGPLQGAGAGAILTPESLERDEKDLNERKRKAKLSKAEAVAWVQSVLPHFRAEQVERLVDAATQLEAQGVL